MSKGNPLLGYSRGKVGDLVLTRGEGQQIMRARNRSPRNPKTEKQMYQRAIMATAMLAYKAGLVIFDHSFQGKKKGLENMKQFLSTNAKKLRANIIADLAGDTVTSSVVSPGAITPIPYTYRISEGTMPSSPLTITESEGSLVLMCNAADALKVNQVFTPGDIHTLVVIAFPISDTVNPSVTDEVSSPTIFGFIRMTVKSTLPDKTIEEAKYNEVFDIELFNASSIGNNTLGTVVNVNEALGSGIGAAGVIRSREDSGLRSTTDMFCTTVGWGVVPSKVPDVWNASVQGLGQSSLILEGGDGE